MEIVYILRIYQIDVKKYKKSTNKGQFFSCEETATILKGHHHDKKDLSDTYGRHCIHPARYSERKAVQDASFTCTVKTRS